METTRHFTATVYVVNREATVLHEHERLGMWLPPGGHIARDELPHEAAIREAREETGLAIDLIQTAEGTRSQSARPLPPPATLLLEDINVHDGQVGHQHIDFIYFATTPTRQIDPDGEDEVRPEEWRWFTAAELAKDGRFDPDVRELGIEAIETSSTDS